MLKTNSGNSYRQRAQENRRCSGLLFLLFYLDLRSLPVTPCRVQNGMIFFYRRFNKRIKSEFLLSVRCLFVAVWKSLTNKRINQFLIN